MKYLLGILLILFMLAACSQTDQLEESTKDENTSEDDIEPDSGELEMTEDAKQDLYLYYLQIDVQNMNVEVAVNGIPIVEEKEYGGLRTERPIADWIKPGKNTFTLKFEESPVEGAGAPEAEIIAYIADPDAVVPEPKVTLGTLKLPEEGQNLVLPAEFTIPFTIDKSSTTKVWDDAEKIETLSDEDKEQIDGQIAVYRDALAAKEYEKAADLLEYRFGEMMKTSMSGNSPRPIVIKQWESFLGDGVDYPVPPAEEVEHMLVGDGQLVYVVHNTADGAQKDVVIGKKGEAEFGFPVYLAKIDNKWVIVR